MIRNYSGATRIIPIVGDPIAQVKAPRGLSLAFEQRGEDILVVPFHIKPGDVQAFFQTMSRAPNVGGMLATVPHKFAAFQFAATSSSRAQFFLSANALRRTGDGRWYGDMLDGLGYVRAIEKIGATARDQKVLLVGAGGAGSAVGAELLNAGAAHLAVHDADTSRRDALLAKIEAAHPGKTSRGTADPTGFTLVVNATPMGMKAGDPAPVEFDRLAPGMIVGDVITVPEITPLLQHAKSLGCRIVTGVDMFNASTDLLADFFLGVDG